MSKLKALLKKHREEIIALRKECKHPVSSIKIYLDRGVVGAGSSYPSVWVICKNCGKKKIMFRNNSEEAKVQIEKTLERQTGIKDQRLDSEIHNEWELE